MRARWLSRRSSCLRVAVILHATAALMLLPRASDFGQLSDPFGVSLACAQGECEKCETNRIKICITPDGAKIGYECAQKV